MNRKTIMVSILIVLLIFMDLAVLTTFSGSHGSPVHAPYERAQPEWPDRVFSPYADICLWPTPRITDIMNETGVSFFNLAFVISDGSGNPAWGGVYPVSSGFYKEQIEQLRRQGGDVRIAFGGANGPYLVEKYNDATELANAYEKVITTYNVMRITFDVEGAYIANQEMNDRRARAIAILQSRYPDLKVGFTLPVLPSGLTVDGLNLLRNAIQNGVSIDTVDIMAMDYGDWAAPNPEGKMGDYAIQAAQSTFSQLKLLYPHKSDEEVWRMLSVTPMIGQNDIQSERFYPSDAKKLLNWANQTGVGELSMWSITRDHPGTGDLSHHTGLTNVTDYEYSRMFNHYTSSTVPEFHQFSILPVFILLASSVLIRRRRK